MKKLKNFEETNYTPDLNFMYDDQEGVVETFEIDKLKEVNKKRIWTVMDSEINDDIIIVAGCRFFNRIHYLVTNEEWQDENEVYTWVDFSDF